MRKTRSFDFKILYVLIWVLVIGAVSLPDRSFADPGQRACSPQEKDLIQSLQVKVRRLSKSYENMCSGEQFPVSHFKSFLPQRATQTIEGGRNQEKTVFNSLKLSLAQTPLISSEVADKIKSAFGINSVEECEREPVGKAERLQAVDFATSKIEDPAKKAEVATKVGSALGTAYQQACEILAIPQKLAANQNNRTFLKNITQMLDRLERLVAGVHKALNKAYSHGGPELKSNIQDKDKRLAVLAASKVASNSDFTLARRTLQCQVTHENARGYAQKQANIKKTCDPDREPVQLQNTTGVRKPVDVADYDKNTGAAPRPAYRGNTE